MIIAMVWKTLPSIGRTSKTKSSVLENCAVDYFCEQRPTAMLKTQRKIKEGQHLSVQVYGYLLLTSIKFMGNMDFESKFYEHLRREGGRFAHSCSIQLDVRCKVSCK